MDNEVRGFYAYVITIEKMNQNTENLLAGQQQNSKESEDQRDLKSVHTPSRMNESGMVIYDEEDIPKTTYTNFTIDSEPAFSSPINSFRHSPSTGQTSSNNRPSSGRKSIADLCALPQWKIDLMEKNKEDIEWRKNLKNKYKTTIFEKRTSGYFMKREDIQEEKKDIYSSYRTTTPRPYIPKGEYIAPEKPIVHPDREQMVFKKRFNYHTQNVKPIFDSNAKRFSQIRKEKEEEMKRHKAEEQQKLEEKKEKIKREKEERRQRLTKLLTKKPPVSGEEIHKQRVEQAKMDRQQKTQKPVVLYPVIESHKLKVRLSEGNSSINGSPNKSPTLRNSLSSPQLIAQTEKEVKVESKSEESLKEYERTPVDSKFQDENKTTQSEENMGEIDQPNSENKHSDKVKEVFTDELHGDLSFELSDEEELVSSSPSPNKVQGHLEGEEEIFELSSDEEENLPSKTKEDDNSIVGSKMIIPLIQFEEDILDNLEKSSYTDTDLLTPEEHQTIYMSLDNLCRIKQSMLRDLKSSVESKSFTTLWDSSNVSMFKDIMTSYVDGIPMSLEIFSEKAAKNSSKSEELMGMVSWLVFVY